MRIFETGDKAMNNFGENIFNLRRKSELTQDSLAERLGVTAQAVSKWERGESMPDVSLLPSIAEIFGVTIDSLFGREDKPITEYVPEKQRDIDKRILHIEVNDCKDHVKINVPLILVKTAIELGMSAHEMKFGNVDLSQIDFATVLWMIENGALGRIIEVDYDDGANVVVEVI